jgi:signal transduction histidine kinase
VEDNGKGFPSAFNSKWGQLKGFGLFSIRERLLPVGGNINIYSEPDKGATICLEAPLTEKDFKEPGR